jgi:hypothetical protein
VLTSLERIQASLLQLANMPTVPDDSASSVSSDSSCDGGGLSKDSAALAGSFGHSSFGTRGPGEGRTVVSKAMRAAGAVLPDPGKPRSPISFTGKKRSR